MGTEVESAPATLFQKVWDRHVVTTPVGSPSVLYIDLHLLHEVTSPQAFSDLKSRGLNVRRPDRTLATMDHSTPTSLDESPGEQAAHQLATLRENTQQAGIELHAMGTPDNGIIHVMAPELGRVWPGMTVVCGDSHTSTHGAFGALAFGIGTSEVGHVLATQCLLQEQPKTLLVNFKGSCPNGVSAKDMILALIAEIGTDGATGHVIEYRGESISTMDMDGRMTICNMSIEAGARAGMIAPDDTAFDYLRPRLSNNGLDAEALIETWRKLKTDEGASFDRVVTLDVSSISPMVTFGTNPAMGVPVTGSVPVTSDSAVSAAIDYMGLAPGQEMANITLDVVFIGSCTNGRLADLREAASILNGQKVAESVRLLIVPGSHHIKRQAEAEGLDQVFLSAGAEWREPGCSMCLAMNADRLAPGQRSLSTSNRNFVGRQGPGGRTMLGSPATAAASAITGRVTDPRSLSEVNE